MKKKEKQVFFMQKLKLPNIILNAVLAQVKFTVGNFKTTCSVLTAVAVFQLSVTSRRTANLVPLIGQSACSEAGVCLRVGAGTTHNHPIDSSGVLYWS